MTFPKALEADIEVAGLRDVLHERDLESQDIKKIPGISVTPLEDPEKRLPLGRRQRSTNFSAGPNETLGDGDDEDALTRIGNFLWKIHSASIITRYALYILPVAVLLAVPLVVTATAYADARADGIRLLGLFIWIEIIWLALWFSKLISKVLPIVFQAACGLISTGIRKYSLVLTALEIPLSLLLWVIVSFATTNVICVFDQGKCDRNWLTTLRKVFKAGIVVAAIFLVEKTLVQLISINYHRKQYDEKIRESKKLIGFLDLMYDTSRQLFPEFCREFEQEDSDIQSGQLTSSVQTAKLGRRIFKDLHRVTDKVAAGFGAMASDVTGRQLFSTTTAHSIVLKALESETASRALARRIWLSFAVDGNEVLYKHDLVEVLGNAELANKIFDILDRDENGDVSLEEMTLLIIEAGNERKNRAASMQDISQAIGVLDKLMSLVVLIAIALIYASFFSQTFSNKTTQLWASITGLSFAIGGTVTEFLACCIYLFIKHPYDVGDRVDINDQELIVTRISLMYSVFQRVENGATLQIPHNVASGLWIENVSRSRQMKERLSINVAATTSMEDILALRAELQKFVTAEVNRRDYQPEFNIELLSIGNMQSLELRIEIRHKSNFANEMLRNARRNKFMCELLSAMRRVPIEPPGGSAPPLGDPANPAYSVSVSNNEAIDARAAKATSKEAARLHPVGTSLESLAPEATAAGFLTPAQAMFPGMRSRNGNGHQGVAHGWRNASIVER